MVSTLSRSKANTRSVALLEPTPAAFDLLCEVFADGVAPSRSEEEEAEWQRCNDDAAYFIENYVQILNANEKSWVPFALWDAQKQTLKDLQEHPRLCILKARQLGFSWLVLAYVLWVMLFRPIANILLFSKRDDEAIELLEERLKKMHDHLPAWLQQSVDTSNDHEWALANGSRAKAFPTTGGRSYTGTIAVVDEADFVPDLDALINAVEPTVEAGGQMILLSTSDKSQPMSAFKNIFKGAKRKLNSYLAVFFGWAARPGRTQEWYEAKKQDVLARTGSLDELHQEYPATDTEALSPNTEDKRIPAIWIEQCYEEIAPLNRADDITSFPPGAPYIPGLVLYKTPVFGLQYVMGGDPAEGNPTSDNSSCHVLERVTGEEVAKFTGKSEPDVFGSYMQLVGRYFNRAEAMIERNNHGHSVIQWLEEHAPEIRLLDGQDGKTGWLSHVAGKVALYDAAAETLRTTAPTKILHSYDTYMQLASIEGATLRAPKDQPDDEADSWALAQVARRQSPAVTKQSNYLTDPYGPEEEE